MTEQAPAPAAPSEDRHDRSRVLRPVREQAADGLWLVVIVAMSLTVLATRVYLELSGYPQVGGGGPFHVAHVLWGGLLLFIAVVLPLSIANRWALWASAVFGGIGAGLFIDEVGKFLTSNNDYFVPLALPVIYAFILVCIWLAYRLSRRRARDPRTLLYHALGDLKQVLDHDLDPFEHRELIAELEQVLREDAPPDERQLATVLLDYVHSREVRLAARPNPIERFLDDVRRRAARWPSRRILRGLLVAGFALIGFQAAGKLLVLEAAASKAGPLLDALRGWIVIAGKGEYVLDHPVLLLGSDLAVAAIGVLALVAAGLLLAGRDTVGLRVGVLALVIALTVVDLFVFYFSQLAAVTEAVLQVALLGLAALYRWRFLGPEAPGRGAAPSSEGAS